MDYMELLRKTDIGSSDLSAGGLLNPEQSNRFFRKVMDAPTILREARTIPMNGPTKVIDKIGLGSRILRVANQGNISSPRSGEEGTRALARADRAKPTTDKITLTTSELIAEVDIPYEVLEDNIEKDQLQNTIMDLMAQQVANDLEEKIILGDIGSGDSYLALRNGIIAAASSHVVNNSGAEIDVTFFKDMINALPAKYHNQLNKYRFFASTIRELDFRATLAGRQTGLGDQLLQSNTSVSPLGVPLRGASQMPNANVMLLDPMNLIVGYQRQIRIEFDRDIRERVIVAVITLRMDHQFEEEDMVVKGINVG